MQSIELNEQRCCPKVQDVHTRLPSFRLAGVHETHFWTAPLDFSSSKARSMSTNVLESELVIVKSIANFSDHLSEVNSGGVSWNSRFNKQQLNNSSSLSHWEIFNFRCTSFPNPSTVVPGFHTKKCYWIVRKQLRTLHIFTRLLPKMRERSCENV